MDESRQEVPHDRCSKNGGYLDECEEVTLHILDDAEEISHFELVPFGVEF